MHNLPQGQSSLAYFDYLRNRSLSGFLYRKFWLYPRLARRLKGRVLDYGCGIGDFLSFRKNTIGADINEYNVTYCTRNGLEAKVVEDRHIPFADEHFDGVMLDNVLEHIPVETVDSVIEEIIRVLTPGGVIVAGVPGLKGYNSDPDHKVYYTKDGLVTLFARHGFEAKEFFLEPIPFQWLERVVRQFCIYAVFTAARPSNFVKS